MKEDDMDEMMRKAAEHYEVDANRASDWNAVYKAVHETDDLPPAEEKRKRRFVFWWLLLIPLGLISYTVYNKFYADNIKLAEKNVTVSPARPKAGDNINAKQPALEQAPKTAEESATKNSTEQNKVRDTKNSKTQSNRIKLNNNSTSRNLLFTETTNKEEHTNVPALQNENSNEAGKNDMKQVEKENTSNVAPALNFKNDSSASAINEKQVLNNTDDSKVKKAIPLKLKKQDHYFYSGLMIGGDLSFVKYQQAQPIGYNVGLLVGYKFNKLSVESGLFFDKKNYYTDGKYFDKSNIPYFMNAQILTVDGYCQMFEIPLNARYNFIEKKRHVFFATAGLSSYLMNKEFYNYDYIWNGEQHYGSRAYLHATKNWFSILNLSAGYELNTGAKTSLRVEPYFKAPLSGVGTGDLSISSIGINVGITRRIP